VKRSKCLLDAEETTNHQKEIPNIDDHKIVRHSILSRIFGFRHPTEAGLSLARILIVLLPAFSASFQISTSFFMIYIAESLGGGDYIAGLTLVGILVVVQTAVQTALDYPTGVLGDWIGQRFVIASALLSYALAFYITSTVTQNTPFATFMVIYILMGFASSQQSGAFEAWFDNNYRVAMPHDEDRKQYGVFWGKLGMLTQVMATLVLIPGSWLALVFSRTWVFMLQSILCVILSIMVMFLLIDLPGVREEREDRPSFSEYTTLLKDGIKFLFSAKFIIFIILGEVFLFAVGPVWWNLLLFPLYFSYLLTDVAVSSYRTLIFVPNAVIQERTGVWAQKFEPKKWIPRFRIFQFNGFIAFLLLALLTFIFPTPQTSETIALSIFGFDIIQMPVESVLPMTIMFAIFVVSGIFGGLAGILTQRVMIDVVPNRIRNSLYSLRPTLVMIMTMPLLVFFGWFMPLFGFPATFILTSLFGLIGTVLVKKAFSHPVPKAEVVTIATEKETEEVEEMEVT